MDLARQLNDCLANVASFYFRAHAAHWNVMGDDFVQMHDLFGEVASDAYGSLDPLAENIRKIDAFPISSLADLASKSEITPKDTPDTDAQELLTELVSLNDGVIKCMNETFAAATRANEQGIANFLADRIDMHQKWRWQMKASIDTETEAPDATEQMDAPQRGAAAPKNTVPKADPNKFRRVAPLVARPPKVSA